MTIQQCRERKYVHVSEKHNRRNCGVIDCSSYPNLYEERWHEEEIWEFDDCSEEH